MRMSRSRILLLTAAAVATLSPPPATAAPQCPELCARLDAYVRQAVADWEVPGLAIAVVKDGATVFARGYGVREMGSEAPVDEHTLFAIGSTTKAMTAAAIGMLVDEGKLGWDSRVAEILPEFELANPWMTRELTVRDLLTHRAGLGNADMLWFRTGREREDILRRVRFVPEAYSPRSSFIYQNLMYAAAGEVVTRISGTPWRQFVRERIFKPLGMTGTVPVLAETLERDNVATPHDRVDGQLQVITNASVDSIDAAGSVWSSVTDMARWARLMLDGEVDGARLLEPQTQAELLKPQTIVTEAGFYPTAELTRPHWKTYSLGWFQHDYDGRAVSFHTGSIDGMVAIIGLIPDERLGVYVLANRDHAEVRHALMYKVFDLWGGSSDGRDWSADLLELYGKLYEQGEQAMAAAEAARVDGTTPSHPISDYAGRFRDELYGEVSVLADDDGLRLVYGDLTARLEHWHYDTFRAHWEHPWMGDFPLVFRLDASGEAGALEIMGRSFRRITP